MPPKHVVYTTNSMLGFLCPWKTHKEATIKVRMHNNFDSVSSVKQNKIRKISYICINVILLLRLSNKIMTDLINQNMKTYLIIDHPQDREHS